MEDGELRTTAWVGLVDTKDYTGLSALSEATNVCITDSGNIVTRVGHASIVPLLNIHSLFVVDSNVYAVTPSSLYIVDNGVATLMYNMGGGNSVAHVKTPQGTILTDGHVGVIINGMVAKPWVGTTGGLDTVGIKEPDLSEARLAGIPTTPATPCLGYGNGKLVSIVEGVAVHTFPYTITVNNPEEYVALPSDVKVATRVDNITVLSSVDGTYLYDGEAMRKVSDHEMILGSPVVIDGDVIGLGGQSVVVFATTGGTCYVTSGGEYKELTSEKVSWYTAQRASAAVIRVKGSWQYVVRMVGAEPHEAADIPSQAVVRR
jgi:hypothetical protein